MKHFTKFLLVLAGTFGMLSASVAADAVPPTRIAYIEGGPNYEFQAALSGLAAGLKRLDVIDNGDVRVPEGTSSTADMWQWLAKNSGGLVEFVPDAYYSADWDNAARAAVTRQLLDRIRDRGDIDMVLAMGTWPGQDLAAAGTGVPVIVAGVTDAVEAGIVVENAGPHMGNLAVTLGPDAVFQQVVLFESVFGFKKMGIVYEDTPSGRAIVSLEAVESAARQAGVELVRCTGRFNEADERLVIERLTACHRRLVQDGAQAVYVTFSSVFRPETAKTLLEPLIAAKIPTFSQMGPVDVRNGVLLSVSQRNPYEEGIFAARQLAAVLIGAKPGEVNQSFEGTASLALNLDTAKAIGWEPPFEILVVVDEFYGDEAALAGKAAP